MRLSRYQLTEANRRIQENLWKEEIFQATQKKFISAEPEKFQYLQARYLNLLGKSEEAREGLKQLVKANGPYADKAQFELFISDLEALPYQKIGFLSYRTGCLKILMRKLMKKLFKDSFVIMNFSSKITHFKIRQLAITLKIF